VREPAKTEGMKVSSDVEETPKKPTGGVLAYVESLLAEKRKVELQVQAEEEEEVQEVQPSRPNYLAQIEGLLSEKFKDKKVVDKIMSGEFRPKFQSTSQIPIVSPSGKPVRKRRRTGVPNANHDAHFVPHALRELRTVLSDSSQSAVDKVIEFLDNGGDPNQEFIRGIRLLHETTNVEITKLLISRGANVNATDYLNRTPLHYATKEKATKVAEVLISNGADIDAKTTKGWTPLFDASRWESFEIMDMLLKAGADVTKIDSNGNTPLHIAVSFYRHAITKKVLGVGVPINTQNNKGETALHIASKPRVVLKEQKSVVLELLKSGADKTIKDSDNNTPFDIAKNSVKRLLQ
jgi:hypothetical protein